MPTPQELLQYQQLFNQFMPIPKNKPNPNMLFGGLGLLGLSQLGRDEPGYVTEARQNLRNLSSPTGFSSGFTNTVGGLQSQFQPLLDQQQKRALDQIQQRYTAAFPSTFGPQGPEFGAYGNYLRDQFLPQQQAFYGNMGLQGLNTQANAASKILEGAQPNALNAALGTLGGLMAYGGLQGQGSGTFGGGGFDLSSLFGGGQQGGIPGGGVGGLPGLPGGGGGPGAGIGGLLQSVGGNPQLLSPQVQQMLYSGLKSAFQPGTFSAGFGGIENLGNGTYAITQTSGKLVGIYDPATGMVTNSATGASAPLSAGGFLVPQAAAGSMLSSLATPVTAGLGGYFSGRAIGGQLPKSQIGATLAGGAGGALAGAAAGTAMGAIFDGPGMAVGAIIGGLAGAAGGFTGSRGAAQKQKAIALAADQKSQGDTTSAIGSFWTSALGDAGYENIDRWGSLVSQTQADVNGPARSYSFDGISTTNDQPDNLAYIGSRLLLRQIQQKHPEITSLDQVPKFRETYIDYIMQNTFIGGEKGVSHPSSIAQKGSLLTNAGLSY